IIGNDGSPQADALVRSVASRTWPEKTEAQIISAIPLLAPQTTELDASTFAQEHAYAVIREADQRTRVRLGHIAAEAADGLRRAGLSATKLLVDADPREAILAAAERFKADTIFVGARGHGRMERLMLGSISSHIVTHASCAVEVVRSGYGIGFVD